MATKTPKSALDQIIDQELDRALKSKTAKEEAAKLFTSKLSLDLNECLIPTFSKATYKNYHHVTWWVSNAKQSAFYFITCFGFKPFAYRGLETGFREYCSYVIRNGDVIFEFCSPLRHNAAADIDAVINSIEINNFIEQHGDGVKDVAFQVSSVDEVFKVAIKGGARKIQEPIELGEAVKIATVSIFGDTYHTLVERPSDYKGFLPGYVTFDERPELNIIQNANLLTNLPPINLIRVDHCVQNQGWNKMVESCEKYAKSFGFHQFWSVDEKDVSTEFSALHSIVMSSPDDLIKMPINEPAVGRCKSQIEEFLDFYDGPGIQHIALLTDNILETVSAMRYRGVEFISVPSKYYDLLRQKMADADFKTEESLQEIEKLGILIDFDENGYLLQLFTKPLVVRPTVFIEIIQRRNHNGFGAGNFKALFETLEVLQKERGNLTESTSS